MFLIPAKKGVDEFEKPTLLGRGAVPMPVAKFVDVKLEEIRKE